VAFRLGREGLHQPHDDQAADDGRQDDEGAPWTRRVEGVGVVVETEPAEKEKIMNPRDHGAEHHRAERGHDADENG
jgi:hypothetical protein